VAAAVAVTAALVACGSTVRVPRSPMSAKELIEKSKPAVVRIEVVTAEGNGLGTGFGVGGGRVATNLHVIYGAREAAVVLANGDRLPVASVIAFDEDRDLAIIGVAAPELPSLPIGDSDAVAQGDRVYAIGNPLGADYTISDGLISAVRVVNPALTVLQTTAAISRGSSGGPLLNPYGEVIGVATAFLAEGQNLNFGMPSNYLRPLIETQGAGLPFVQFVARARARTPGADRRGPRVVRKIPDYELSYLDGCSDDNLTVVMQEIAAAIEKGAPLYNQGDHEACYRIYEGVALKLETTLSSTCRGPREALGQGLLRAETLETYTEKAWAMRDAFDGLLGVILERLRPER
jgi:hypothetical protein